MAKNARAASVDSNVWVTMTSFGFDRAQHLVGVHAVLGLGRRETVVDLLPCFEVVHAVANESNGARH
jgi:hypothetical protein